MYKMTIPEKSSSNCFDCVFYSFLKYFGFDYEAYNIKYLYTDYYDDMTNRICRSKSYINALKDIYGIDLIGKKRDESSNLLEIICVLLNNGPIGITIDPYYCYWSPFYQKAHYSHMILIVGIDYCNKKYVCFDAHFNSIGYVEVDFDTIDKNYIRYFTFRFEEVNEVKLEVVTAQIKSLVNSFDNNLDMKKSQMTSYFTMNDRRDLFPDNLATSIPLINLMWIAEDREHFPIALRYLENKLKKDMFSSVYELATISQRKFILLKSMLIKYAMTGVLREDSLKSVIEQIFDTDAIMIEQMKNALGYIE